MAMTTRIPAVSPPVRSSGGRQARQDSWLHRGVLALVIAALCALMITPVAQAQDDDEAREPVGKCSSAVSDVAGGDIGLDTVWDGVQCVASGASPATAAREAAASGADATVAVKDKIEGVFGDVIAAIGAGALRAVMWTMTFWLDKDSTIVLNAGGNVDDTGRPANSDNLIFKIQDYTIWLQGLLGVFSILAIAVRFIMTRWSEAEDSVQNFIMTLGRIVLTTAVWVPVVMLATRMTDGLASWILTTSSDQAVDSMKQFLSNGDFADNWNIALAWGNGGSQGTAALVLIASIVSIITSVLQIVFSFVRDGMLIILAAVVPMVAYASGLESGREAWGKVKGWTIALLLFKPAAALVYAIAFLAVGEIGEDDSIGVLGILTLFGMAVLVLPSLISLVAPAAGMAPAGGSGMRVAGALGTAAAAGAVAGAAGSAFGGGSKAMAGSRPTGQAGPAAGSAGGSGGSGPDGSGPTGPGGGGSGGDGDGGSPTGAPSGSGSSTGSGSGGSGGEGDVSMGGASSADGSGGGSGAGGGEGDSGMGGAGGSPTDDGASPAGLAGAAGGTEGGAGESGPADGPPQGPAEGSAGGAGETGGSDAGSPGAGTPSAGGSGGGGESGGFDHGAAARASGASLAASATGSSQPSPTSSAGTGSPGRSGGGGGAARRPGSQRPATPSPRPQAPKHARTGPPPIHQLRVPPSTPPSGVPR